MMILIFRQIEGHSIPRGSSRSQCYHLALLCMDSAFASIDKSRYIRGTQEEIRIFLYISKGFIDASKQRKSIFFR